MALAMNKTEKYIWILRDRLTILYTTFNVEFAANGFNSIETKNILEECKRLECVLIRLGLDHEQQTN